MGKFELPVHAVLEPEVFVLFPLVMETKSSWKSVANTAGAGWTVRTNVEEPVPPALLAETVTKVVPAKVGLPEMTPELVLTVSPPGRPVAP